MVRSGHDRYNHTNVIGLDWAAARDVEKHGAQSVGLVYGLDQRIFVYRRRSRHYALAI